MKSVKTILLCAAVAASAATAAETNGTATTISTYAMVSSGTNNPAADIEAPFSIPKSLVFRMYEAADAARDRALAGPGGKAPFADTLEFVGLSAAGTPELALAAQNRPRGNMLLVNDGNDDEERRELWPFDVEGFERKLERRMVRGEDGCFLLPEENGTRLAANPTIRRVNAEIAAWAIRELDGKYPRMSTDDWRGMTGSAAIPEGMAAWRLDPLYCFVLEDGEGAWNPRTYSFVFWKGTGTPVLVAAFDSFPNDREATAALCLHCDPPSANNLAVLEWRHQSFRMSMSPARIRTRLESARKAGVREAAENLSVLRAHLPECFDDVLHQLAPAEEKQEAAPDVETDPDNTEEVLKSLGL